jgi:hypothetical protein
MTGAMSDSHGCPPSNFSTVMLCLHSGNLLYFGAIPLASGSGSAITRGQNLGEKMIQRCTTEMDQSNVMQWPNSLIDYALSFIYCQQH